jgi:NADPH:quinone reductase-like Zn-dependent oxidoreductase
MKAIVYDKHASPAGLKCVKIDKPIPGEDEVLIRVRAASVNPLDYHLLRHPMIRRVMTLMSKQKTTRPGRDLAGEVEAVGASVTQFAVGDEVFGVALGAFAEYAVTSESRLAAKPDNMSFAEAAAVPVAGLTALQGLRDHGAVQPGQRVLINGAAGGVGTFAVQIAKTLGADVTAVCSTRNVEMVRALGAARVIDYTEEDYTRSGDHFDLIFDLAGNHSFAERRSVLNPKGIYIGAGMVALSLSVIGLLAGQIAEYLRARFVSQKFGSFIAKIDQKDLTVMAEFMKSGKVTPVIDRSYSLPEVPDAIRYVEQHHARGKVVITLETYFLTSNSIDTTRDRLQGGLEAVNI